MDPKEKVKQQFGKNAQKYVESESHAKASDLDELVQWLQPHTGMVALDIATGGGHVAKKLAPNVKCVFATDLTKEMLEKTRIFLQEYSNVSYVLADAEKLPFLDDSFDIVTCRIAPHHFPNPTAFISEVSRVLVPKGKFILIDNIAPEDEGLANFMNTFEKLRDKSHVRCLSQNDWLYLFKKHNLKVVRENKRKKTHDYATWIKVTAESREQQEQVTEFILKGKDEQLDYFSVKTLNGKITSVTIDECMILGEKMET